jgi:hypothetical protein
MARVRSPNYPAISLPEAIERVRKIYNKEHTSKASPDVVVKAMGYNGLNGASMTILSALKKYGLLEEVGKELKVSHAALTILVDQKDSEDRISAIRQAAFAPALFSELRQQYPDAIPSDDNMRSFLLKRGFLQSAVDAPIRAYRETMALVSELQKEDNLATEEAIEEQAMPNSNDQATVLTAQAANAPIQQAATPTSGYRRDIFSLDEGQVVLEWPEKMSADSYEDFQSWVELQLRKIKRSIN